MIDIVERLRSRKMKRVGGGQLGEEAAAEIERLRALVARAIERGGCGSSMWLKDARVALTSVESDSK